MKGSPLIITMTKSGSRFVSNERVGSNFYIKEGHHISIIAEPIRESSKAPARYTMVIESRNHLRWDQRAGFKLMTIAIMTMAIIWSLYPFTKNQDHTISELNEKVQQLNSEKVQMIAVGENKTSQRMNQTVAACRTEIEGLHRKLFEKEVQLGEAKRKLEETNMKLVSASLNTQSRQESHAPLKKEILQYKNQVDSLRNKVNLAYHTIEALSATINEARSEKQTISALTANTMQSMELFYQNKVLETRNFHHARIALEGLDQLIEEYQQEAFQPLRKSFYRDYKDGIDRYNKKNRKG